MRLAVGTEGFAEVVEGGVDVFVAVCRAELFGEFDRFVDGDGGVDVEARQSVRTCQSRGWRALPGRVYWGRRWVCSATRVS